ncbi:MAG TPA: YceI family protein [Prolixibacteraceae bacterium]|jgi:polyisoprenoid-binding protein YceI
MKLNKITGKTQWSIDQENSEIGFNVKHLMITYIKGEFKTFNASIFTSGRGFGTTEINLWISTYSITTNNVKRDRHLKSSDFFDIKNNRQITFKSRTIGRSVVKGDYNMWGELTMMGVSRIIKLNIHLRGIITDRSGHKRAAFTVTGIINRSDWGLTWNSITESGSMVISDEVEILCEIEVTNKIHSEPETQSEFGDDNRKTLWQLL